MVGRGLATILLLLSAGAAIADEQIPMDGPSGFIVEVEPASGGMATFNVRCPGRAWCAVGFNNANYLSMTGGGAGSDIFACTGGEVQRFWVTSKSRPTGGVDVEDSECEQVAGSTEFEFSRKLEATGDQQIAIYPDAAMRMIWAIGSDGDTSLSYHWQRGGRAVTFKDYGLEEPTPAPTPIPTSELPLLDCFGLLHASGGSECEAVQAGTKNYYTMALSDALPNEWVVQFQADFTSFPRQSVVIALGMTKFKGGKFQTGSCAPGTGRHDWELRIKGRKAWLNCDGKMMQQKKIKNKFSLDKLSPKCSKLVFGGAFKNKKCKKVSASATLEVAGARLMV